MADLIRTDDMERTEAAGSGAADARSARVEASSPRGTGIRTPRADAHRVRLPLSFVIVRYFAYALVLLAFVWVCVFAALSVALQAGAVYPANYGSAHMGEQAHAIADAGAFVPSELPTAFRYLLVDADGKISATVEGGERICAEGLLESFSSQATGRDGAVSEVVGASGYTLAAVRMPDGSTLVLSSDYLPRFVDPGLDAALPNPQNIMLAAGCAMSAVALGCLAHRASKVLTRKMEPLVAAADAVSRRDLDVPPGRSNVSQIDDILLAMDRMRISLKEALESEWRAEQRQREQIAALAHDLKTPLTVIRGNADLLAEDARDGLLGEDQAAAARSVAEAAGAADALVGRIITVSRRDGEARDIVCSDVHASDLIDDVARCALELAKASARDLDVCRADELVQGDGRYAERSVRVDLPSIERAVSNLVANAIAYAPKGRIGLGFHLDSRPESIGGGAALRIVIEDEGPGFSSEAIAHARERFWRADVSRSGAARGGHWGLGLAIVDDIASAHGGALEIENVVESGRIAGARATLVLPMSECERR